MLLVGFVFWAQSWTALADRGMTRCKALKAYTDKKALIALRDRKGGGKAGAASAKVAVCGKRGRGSGRKRRTTPSSPPNLTSIPRRKKKKK